MKRPKRKPSDTKILVFHEKHGNRYFLFQTAEEREAIAEKIVKERSTGNYAWYTPEEVTESDARTNWEFLQFREDYEYEGFEIEHPEAV